MLEEIYERCIHLLVLVLFSHKQYFFLSDGNLHSSSREDEVNSQENSSDDCNHTHSQASLGWSR